MIDNDWRAGLVSPTGANDDGMAIMGQWADSNRWNGWLSPLVDPLGVEQILGTVKADVDYWLEYGFDWRWEQDRDGVWCLIVVDRQYLSEEQYPAEVLEPDGDGLYGLGAWGWTWAEIHPSEVKA